MRSSDTSQLTQKMETWLGNILRIGVIVSTVVVLSGGILYLYRYGLTWAHYSAFKGEPEQLKNIYKIFSLYQQIKMIPYHQQGIVG